MTNKLDEIQNKLNDYFTEKLEQHGTTAKGVDYNGEQAREIRFAELVKIMGSFRSLIMVVALEPCSIFYTPRIGSLIITAWT
jgi:hypothetical protein